MRERNKIFLVISIVVLLLVIVIILFRNISFKNDYIQIDMTTGDMEIQVPKYTFDLKTSDNNISIKSFQSNRIVKKELKNILSTYEKISCNDKDYYYNKKDGYTIIDYGVNNHFIFNTIYIKYSNYNYCDYLKLQEYTEKLDGYAKMHTFGTLAKDNKTVKVALIINGFNKEITFTAQLTVQTKNGVLEKSDGTFVIENNVFTYTRTDISEKNNDITIPKVSTFTIIENGVLKLDDNYLSKYESEIVLK